MIGTAEVDVVDSVAGLRAYETQWNDLLLQSESRHPMCSYAWVSSFVESLLEEGTDWACLFVLDGDRLIGVLPILEKGSRWMGGHVVDRSTLASGHAMSIGITAEPGREAEVVRAMLPTLLCELPGTLGRVHFLRHFPGRAAELLATGRTDVRVRRAPAGVGSFLHVPEDFSDFRASLSGNFRGNLNKAKRKLDALADVRFSFLRDDEGTEKRLERFGAVEADGWKGRGGTAIMQSRSVAAFYRSATRRLARAGWLEWHFLEAAGHTIAGHLAIKCGRTLLVWKVGFRERFAYCSPGNLLFEEMIRRRCASQDVDRIDVLTEYSWHRLWTMTEREFVDITLYSRRSTQASFHYMVDRGRSALGSVPGVRRLRRMLPAR